MRITEIEKNPKLLVSQRQLDNAHSNVCQVLINMDPSLFLTLTTDTRQVIDDIKATSSPLRLYNQWTEEGEIIVMPFLRINNLGKIEGHEGRHRAAAVINAGGNELLVAIKIVDTAQSYIDKEKYDFTLSDLPPIIRGQFSQDIMDFKKVEIVKNGWR